MNALPQIADRISPLIGKLGSPRLANRIDRALAHTANCLREVRRTDRPGSLSGDLAMIWRARLGPAERAFLLAVAAQAAEPEHLDDLGFVLGGPPPFGGVS